MKIGWPEMIVVLVLVLVVFGPQRLPEIARQIGRAIREVRKISGEFEREVRSGLALDEDYGGNFPTWKGTPKPPMDEADPYRPPPAPGSEPAPSEPAPSEAPPPGPAPVEPPAASTEPGQPDEPQANPPG